MVKVAISGYYGFNNFGDEAILSVLINKLKFLNAKITVFSSNPKFSEKNYAVKAIKRFDFFKILFTLLETDILISGGGSLLQDVTSMKSLLYYSFLIFLALLFKKKVIIFAQGIGPLNNKISKIIVRYLLKRVDYVSVRDEKSYKLMKKYKINAELVCDPIYSINVSKAIKSGVVGVQLRNFATMNYGLLTKLAEHIVINFSDKKIEIYSFQNSIDLDICKKFLGILRTLNPDIDAEVISSKPLKETIERISNLEYLIAMRFHAILVALMAGVKTCAINYDIKVERIADEAKIPIISMNAEEDLKNIFKNLEQLQQANILKFAQSKQFNWENFEKIINAK
ncbi:MAG: polysaccharide pyruvyl transferase CsaB [Candidatus Gastranaerophilales bacterium]